MDTVKLVSYSKLTASLQSKNFEKAEIDLYEIEDYISQLLLNGEFGLLREINQKLIANLDENTVFDRQSFVMGKLFTIVEILDNLVRPHEIAVQVNALTALEKRAMRLIHEFEEIVQSDLAEKMMIKTSYMSNVLKKMRSLNLVYYKNSGKYRWYALTPYGQLLLKSIQEINREDRPLLEDTKIDDTIFLERMSKSERNRLDFERSTGSYSRSRIDDEYWDIVEFR
jgi:Transcriptional regulators